MSFRSARPTILLTLFPFHLAGNVLAIPVHNDDAAVPDKADSTTASHELPDLLEPALPSPVQSAANRYSIASPLRLSQPNPAQRSVEPFADEKDSLPTFGKNIQPDPLNRTLRSFVNVTRRQETTGPSPASSLEPQLEFDFGDEGRAVIQEARGMIADTIRNTLDPRADENGRISFSVAGIEGFRILADGDSLSLGLGDSVLASVQRNPREGDNGAYPGIRQASYQGEGYPRSSNQLPEQAYPPGINPIAQAIALAKEVIEHPVTWFILAIYLAFKMVAAIQSMLVATRRRTPSKRRSKRTSAT